MWKILIIAVLFFIVFSLFSALVFLMRDQGKGERTLRSLGWRIGLSVFLLVFIALGYHLGFIS